MVGLLVLFMMLIVVVCVMLKFIIFKLFNVNVFSMVVKILNWVVVLSSSVLGLVSRGLKLVIVFMFIKMINGLVLEVMVML